MFLQTVFLRKFNIGGGLEFQNLVLKSDNLTKANKTIENSNYLSLNGYLNHDTFDDKYFPKKGWYLKSNFNYYFLLFLLFFYNLKALLMSLFYHQLKYKQSILL